MKKSIFVLALLAIVATGAFAQGFSMSAGGGGLFDYSLNNGFKVSIDVPGISGSNVVTVQNLSFGGYGFFDATYAELDVSFAYGRITGKYEASGVFAWMSDMDLGVGNALQLGFTLLGKFPIGLGGFTLFPLLGADYNIVLSYKNQNGNYGKHMDLSQFGLLGGVGFDFPFSKALFLRAEAMFHFRFFDKLTNDAIKSFETVAGGYGSLDKKYGMGPRIQIGLGYRFGGGSGSASSSSSRSGKYMLVNADTLNVRNGPSADNALVGSLPRGTRVEVLDRSGTWWKIRSGNITGYVNSSYLKAP
jgi:outer membrane protein W